MTGLTDETIEAVVERYRRELDRYQKLTDFVAEACREIVKEDGIPATVQWRTKAEDRLQGKLERQRERYSTVDDVFSTMTDLAGVRVATYVESDRPRVAAALEERFSSDGGSVRVEEKNKELPNFYRATHCIVRLTDGDCSGINANLQGVWCEIQVCSLLAHVWNELEHDLNYKQLSGSPSPAEVAALEHLGHLTRAGDGLVQVLLNATNSRLEATTGEFTDQWDFIARMKTWFPASSNFGKHSGQLYDEMRSLGLRSPDEVRRALFDGLDDTEIEPRARGILERVAASVGDAVVYFDADTSDPLMVAFLVEYAPSVCERHPAGRGMGRPWRIRSAASRVLDWLNNGGIDAAAQSEGMDETDRSPA